MVLPQRLKKKVLWVIFALFEISYFSGVSAATFTDDSLIVRKLLDTNGLNSVPVLAVAAPGPRIQELKLSGMDIFVIPSCIGNLDQLFRLVLFDNLITEIPPQIAQCTFLTELRLDHNNIETIPAAIGALGKLTVLSIDENPLREIDTAVAALGIISTLRITGKIAAFPKGLDRCASLSALYLDSNKIETLPESIGDLGKLSILSLRQNRLASLPSSLKRLSALTELCLTGNTLVSLPADCFDGLSKLKTLDLSRNAIAELPPTLCQLQSLEVLNCSENKIANLPVRLPMLVSLKRLNCGNNKLASVEPIRFLPSLTEFKCAYNQLGSLPDSIGNCSLLKVLYANNNDFISLPPSITKLKGLAPDCPYCSTPPSMWPSNLDVGYNRLCFVDDSIRAWLNVFDADWSKSQTCIDTGSLSIKPWTSLPRVPSGTSANLKITMIVGTWPLVVGTSTGQIYVSAAERAQWIDCSIGRELAKAPAKLTALYSFKGTLYSGLCAAGNDSCDLYSKHPNDPLSSAWHPLGLHAATTAMDQKGAIYAGTDEGIYRIVTNDSVCKDPMPLPISLPLGGFGIRVESIMNRENGPLYAYVDFFCQTKECIPHALRSDDGTSWVEERPGFIPIQAKGKTLVYSDNNVLLRQIATRTDTVPSPQSIGGLGISVIVNDTVFVTANSLGVFALSGKNKWVKLDQNISLRGATAIAASQEGEIFLGIGDTIMNNATFAGAGISSSRSPENVNNRLFQESIASGRHGVLLCAAYYGNCSWQVFDFLGRLVARGSLNLTPAASHLINVKTLGIKAGIMRAVFASEQGNSRTTAKKFSVLE